MDYTSIILALITLLGGCGWIFDRKRHKQEVAGLKADNEAKDMQLSKTYVDEWKTNIAEPLQREVKGLRRDVKKLTNAVQKANSCVHSDDCPVINELQNQQRDNDGNGQQPDC